MARHLAGTFGSTTGSGERVTLELDGTVMPNELLLLVVAWEPLALAESYKGISGAGAGYWFYKHTGFTIRQRNQNLDAMTRGELEAYADYLGVEWDESMTDEELKEAIGLYHDFDDVGTVTFGHQLGFAEYYRFSGAAYRGNVFPFPFENGLLVYPAPDLEIAPPGPEFQPSGVAARIQGLWYPEPFSEVVIEFFKRAEYTGTPDELFAVPWCRLLTWKIVEWGGPPKDTADFTTTPPKRFLGVQKAEPAERAGDTFEDPPGYWDAWEWVNPDPLWTNLNRHSATMGVNFTYQGVGTPEDPFPALLGISDGGDTYPTPEPIYDEMVPHILEFGLAGRWGKGFGTDFAWENWPDAIKLGTIDHPHADPSGPDTFIEVYYKLLDSPDDTVPLTATGTWGAQQVDQLMGTIISYADLAAAYSSYGGLAASVSSYAAILAQGSPLFRGAGGYGYLDGPDDPPLVGNGIARTGAMLRGATVGVTTPPLGGWLPQIYRLKGPGQ